MSKSVGGSNVNYNSNNILVDEGSANNSPTLLVHSDFDGDFSDATSSLSLSWPAGAVGFKLVGRPQGLVDPCTTNFDCQDCWDATLIGTQINGTTLSQSTSADGDGGGFACSKSAGFDAQWLDVQWSQMSDCDGTQYPVSADNSIIPVEFRGVGDLVGLYDFGLVQYNALDQNPTRTTQISKQVNGSDVNRIGFYVQLAETPASFPADPGGFNVNTNNATLNASPANIAFQIKCSGQWVFE
jgi:hypothetical protein